MELFLLEFFLAFKVETALCILEPAYASYDFSKLMLLHVYFSYLISELLANSSSVCEPSMISLSTF